MSGIQAAVFLNGRPVLPVCAAWTFYVWTVHAPAPEAAQAREVPQGLH